MQKDPDLKEDLENLREALKQVEQRLRQVELSLGLPSQPDTRVESPTVPARQEVDDVALEYKIGELWVGQVGIVALLIGVAFFISYPFGTVFPSVLQSLVGYLAVGGFFMVSRRWQSSYPYLSRLLFTGNLILLYFSTLRLHFFTSTPIIPSKAVGLTVLMLVLGFYLYLAVMRGSERLALLALFLGFTTSLCSDTTHFALLLVTLASAAAVYLWLRYNWIWGVILSLFLAYTVHLLWVFNNPLLGHPIGARSEHHHNLVYLFVYVVVFGIASFPRRPGSHADLSNIVLPLFNGGGFYGLSTIVALLYFKTQFAGINFFIAVLFLALAVVYWVHRQSTYATALYACLGYVALSAAIFVQFGSPNQFIWLGWQSLLVISTAIWFRSRIVVVANIFIYLGILLSYLLLEPPALSVNLSYAAVALLSARLLNWQKQRLTLRTELIRNVYLASAFVVIPYGLYHGVPGNYVSLSWLGAALFYFTLSLILQNRKYRWLAILTMFLTVIYVFVVDLARLSAIYRMISFLVLGLTMLVVSWIYARYRRQADPKVDESV